jgi:hypothetical protein
VTLKYRPAGIHDDCRIRHFPGGRGAGRRDDRLDPGDFGARGASPAKSEGVFAPQRREGHLDEAAAAAWNNFAIGTGMVDYGTRSAGLWCLSVPSASRKKRPMQGFPVVVRQGAQLAVKLQALLFELKPLRYEFGPPTVQPGLGLKYAQDL